MNATPAGNRCRAVKVAVVVETEMAGRHAGHFFDGGGEVEELALADVTAEDAGADAGGVRIRLRLQRPAARRHTVAVGTEHHQRMRQHGFHIGLSHAVADKAHLL